MTGKHTQEGGGKPRLVVIGPVPPPAFGVATATRLVLDSPVLSAAFHLVHLDTSDRRTVANMGRMDLVNLVLAVKQELRLLCVLATGRPNVMYLTLSQAPLAILRDWIFMRTASAFGCRSVAHLRGSGYADVYAFGPRWLQWILGDSFRQAARVLVLGDGLISMARVIDRSVDVDVVPNGCPPAVSAERSRGEGGRQGTVLFLGGLRRAKGVHDAVRVAARVAVDVPSARFVFAGDWGSAADREEVEHLIEESGIGGNVEFPGSVEAARKAQLLSAASLYLLASHSEGHPWSVIEAMSAGIPVVATRTGAVPDTVVDGTTGYLADVGDIDGLADGVSRILTDDTLAATLSAAGRERYERLFTLERSHALLRDALMAAAREA
jgi:glycosyltransferase involved in cell wall biosynthesis